MATVIGHIAIEDIRPSVDCGRWPAKAAVGERLVIGATIFRDGHGQLAAAARLAGPDGARRVVPMGLTVPGTDRWESLPVTFPTEGSWTFVVEAWDDVVGTWRSDTAKKLGAGRDISLELEEGARLFDAAARRVPRDARAIVLRAVEALRGNGISAPAQPERFAAAGQPDLLDLLDRHPLRRSVTRSGRNRVWVDRERALFGSWYEFFPRSVGATSHRSGTLKQAAERLGPIAAMGFDVVYLPPIHPIGRTHRKGRNNIAEAGPDDPGSPWAIGSAEGGHTTVHPDLGSIEDFDDFVATANASGLEIALDYALQCSPDHPWIREHPDWFHVRPDGSIAYAENPPKVYQDIVPLNFQTGDWRALYAACKQIMDFWIGHGVRIFRVDNPHTKSLRFWAWLIDAVKSEHPDVLLLSEAFTRPPMMRELAKIGFTQSYTYYTWRNTKPELEEYLAEVSAGPAIDYMRPNFFVNTQDILHAYLQSGGLPAFKVRAAVAALASPSWGVYSGYELLERVPLRPGSEEYLDSEKYQYRRRDFTDAPLTPYLAALNRIRRTHPALHELRNLRLHLVDDPNVLAFSKRRADDAVLVVANLDPFRVRETFLRLWMPALGLGWDDAYLVVNELGPGAWRWQGATNPIRLDPLADPVVALRVVRD